MASSPFNIVVDAVPLGCLQCGDKSILDCQCFTGIYYVHTKTTFCYNCHGDTHIDTCDSYMPRMICIKSGSYYCTYCNSCKKNRCICCKKCGYNMYTSCICCSNCKQLPTNCDCILCSICHKLVDNPSCNCASPECFAYHAELYDEDHYYSYNEGKYKSNCLGPCGCRWCGGC